MKLVEGNIVICNEEPAIIAEIRGEYCKVIKLDEKGLPFFSYDRYENIGLTDDQDIREEYAPLYEEFAVAKKFSDKYKHSSFTKAMPAMVGNQTKVPKQVQVRRNGRVFKQTFWVVPKKVKPPAVPTSKKKTEEERTSISISLAKEWKQQLTPNIEQYKKIVAGDKEALGDFIMKALWQPVESETSTQKKTTASYVVHHFAQNIAGVKPEGFEPEDVMQEVALRLLRHQDNNRFDDVDNPVSREKFAGFIAQTIKYTAWDIVRRQKLDKVIAKDISDIADQIADTKAPVDDEDMDTVEGNQRIDAAVRRVMTALPQRSKSMLEMVLSGKSHDVVAEKLGTTVNGVKGVLKRTYAKFAQSLQDSGFELPSQAGVTKLLKQVLRQSLPTNVRMTKAMQIRKVPKEGGGFLFRIVETSVTKARPAEIGEIRTHGGVKKKKTAEGWVPVGDGKTSTSKSGKKKDSPNTGEKAQSDVKERVKDAIKNAVKGLANIMSDVFAGKGGSEAAASEAQGRGADVKNISEAVKQARKRKLANEKA